MHVSEKGINALTLPRRTWCGTEQWG